MVRVVQIGKRRWLAGLTWSSFEDVPSKAELKEDAERLSSSWACVRIGESSIQAGFCAPVPNTKPAKLYSLAAMLADSREQPWLGIFKIEEGLWWYIAVRDGHAILPDGDIIGGEAEIHAARDRHAGYTDWKYIDGDIHLLEEIINEIDAKPTPIKSLTGGNLPSIPLMITAIILVSVLGGGYSWWQKKQQADEERARIAAMEKIRAQMANKQAVVAPTLPSPLLTSAPPNLWLAACGQVIRAMPLSQYGWTLDQVSCDKGAAQIHWDRQPGATVAQKPDGALSPSGDKVDQVIPLTGLDGQWPDDAINLADAILILRAWAQSADFALVVNAVAPPPPPQTLPGATILPTQNNPAPVPPPQAGVRLDVPVSPFSMDLSSIPGLRLTKLSSTGTSWNIEGILYGR